jgi:hypothetical protein
MHAIFEPGSTWEADEKLLLGSARLMPHAAHRLQQLGQARGPYGRNWLRDAHRQGDFFEIPPGHDAYVDGPDRVELILFAPPEHQH